jgi:hypothetical protein
LAGTSKELKSNREQGSFLVTTDPTTTTTNNIPILLSIIIINSTKKKNQFQFLSRKTPNKWLEISLVWRQQMQSNKKDWDANNVNICFQTLREWKKLEKSIFLCVCLSYSASKYCKNYHTVMLKMMNAVEATTPKNCSSSRAIEWIDQFTM